MSSAAGWFPGGPHARSPVRSAALIAAMALAHTPAFAADKVDEPRQLAAVVKLIAAIESGKAEMAAQKIASVSNIGDDSALVQTPREFAARVAGCKGSAPVKWRSHLRMYAVELSCRDGQAYHAVFDAEFQFPYVTVIRFETAGRRAEREAHPPPVMVPPAPPAPIARELTQTEQQAAMAKRQAAMAERDALVKLFADYVVAGAATEPPVPLAELKGVETNRRDLVHQVNIVEEKGVGIAALRKQLAILKPIVGTPVAYECTPSEYIGFCKFTVDRPEAILTVTVSPFNGRINWANFLYATTETPRRDAAAVE